MNKLLILLLSFGFGTIINVPDDYSTIQGGIDAASESDTVLVAAGTYSPSTNSEIFPIEMASGIHLIGSGEDVSIIDAQQNNTVIRMHNCENNIISDLTITGGAGTVGGGMSLSNSNPLLKNITITNNTSYFNGAGMYLNESNPVLTYVTISHNTTSSDGGGMYIRYSDPTLAHVTIAHNVASEGQGILLENSNPTLINSIIYWNTHCHDGWCHDSIYLIGNENEPTITYNNIEGGWSGVGNIDSTPLFANPEYANYTLHEDSPCIDSGTVIEGMEYCGDSPDMGAYEYCEEIEMPECSEMNETECSSNGSCDWVENIEYGDCDDISNGSDCYAIQECTWYSGGNYGYGFDGCYGGTYEIDSSYCEELLYEQGDLNQDNDINVQDIIIVINLILNGEFDSAADLNLDNSVNVLDVIQLVNIILN